jgi:hypothetical protein
MKGMPEAQDTLGAMYALGELGEKDSYSAYIWFYIAKVYGSELANKHLQAIEPLLFDQFVDGIDAKTHAQMTATIMMGQIPVMK